MVNSNLMHLNSTIEKFRYREKILVNILKVEKIKDSFERLNLFFVVHTIIFPQRKKLCQSRYHTDC